MLHSGSRMHADTLLGKEIDQQRTRAAVPLGEKGNLIALVLADTVQIDVEEIGRVKRTALGLGVELSAKDRPSLVDDT